MENLLEKCRVDREPRDGCHICAGCGVEVYHDEVLLGLDGETYCRECAKECACCDLVFRNDQLVNGDCLKCREAEEDD